jgi:glucose-6-phosphate-specific signal transduction histidine kinase
VVTLFQNPVFSTIVREYRSDNQKWTIKRNWQYSVPKRQDEDKQNKNTLYVEHRLAQANTNNVTKHVALLQTTGVKDEPNFLSLRKL